MEYDSNVCLLLMLECLALNKFHEWLGIFACSAASAVYKAKFCRCLTHKQTNKPNKAQFTQGGMAKQFKIHTIRILFSPPVVVVVFLFHCSICLWCHIVVHCVAHHCSSVWFLSSLEKMCMFSGRKISGSSATLNILAKLKIQSTNKNVLISGGFLDSSSRLGCRWQKFFFCSIGIFRSVLAFL